MNIRVYDLSTKILSCLGILVLSGYVATASAVSVPAGLCGLSLNTSSDGAFEVSASDVSAANCGFRSNSVSTSGIAINANSSLSGNLFSTGGIAISSNSSVAGLLSSFVPATADPFNALPEPALPSSCDFTDLSVKGGSHVLSPGTYCGGITILGNAVVSFEPGRYYLVNGDLKVRGPASLSGSGVGFIILGSAPESVGNVSIIGPSEVSLTGLDPVTFPDLPNVLVFQSRSANSNSGGKVLENELSPAIFISSDSVIYSPKRRVTISNSFNGSCVATVADEIKINSGASVTLSPCSGGGGS